MWKRRWWNLITEIFLIIIQNINKIINNNYKGNSTNDFVDRNNLPVPLIGDHYTKYFEWGSQWKVFDDSIDSDQALYNFIFVVLKKM